jgi:hypothetical protein
MRKKMWPFTMMIALLFFQGSALGGQVGYQPSPDQVPLDPLTITKYAQELAIPQVFAPTVVRGKNGQVIRNEYFVTTSHTRVQMLPPPFPMTRVRRLSRSC